MALIEGIGDEVVYCVVVLVVVAMLSLAWLSTHVTQWNGESVWLVQMQTWPQRRLVQMMEINRESAERLRREDNNMLIHIEEVNRQSNTGEQSQSNSTGQSREETTTPSENANSSPSASSHEDSTDGPATANVPSSTIKLKFLDETQKIINTWLSQTVGEFKRQHFETEVDEGKSIRLIYKGQLLRDDQRSLESYGLHDNCILHCHVSSVPYNQPGPAPSAPTTAAPTRPRHANTDHHQSTGLELGRYMHAIFAIKFIFLWSFLALYPQYFDFSSFFSLILCTVIYLTFVYCSYSRHRRAGRNTTAASTPRAQ